MTHRTFLVLAEMQMKRWLQLSVGKINSKVLGDGHFPLVSVGQQLLLVVQQLFVRLCGELEVRTFHDGVHGTGFLAEAAVDALRHVDVVAGCAAATISSGF